MWSTVIYGHVANLCHIEHKGRPLRGAAGYELTPSSHLSYHQGWREMGQRLVPWRAVFPGCGLETVQWSLAWKGLQEGLRAIPSLQAWGAPDPPTAGGGLTLDFRSPALWIS